MKRFRFIMVCTLTLLLAAVAIPFVTQFFEAGSIAQLVVGGGIVLATVPIFGELQTSLQIREKRGELHTLMTDLNKLARTEKRDFTDAEKAKYEEYETQFRALGERLQRVENEEKRMAEMAGAFAAKDNNDKEKREVKSYSLLRAINLQASGKPLDGIELEMHQEAIKEARSANTEIIGIGVPSIVLASHAEKRMTATGQTSVAGDQGGMLVPVEKEGLIMALRPMLVLAKLGAKSFGNMIGNIDMVRGTSTACAWEGENTDADETDIATSKVTLSPKRLAAFTKLSKQLLLQTSTGLEAQVMNDLLAAIAQKVELAAINGSGSGNNQPTGILNTSGIGSVVGGASGAAPTYAHITELESKIELANAMRQNIAYLTNPKVKKTLKNTKIDAGSGLFVWPNIGNELNGYPAEVSTLVPSDLTKVNGETTIENLSAILLGDFSQLEIYNWGGMDITVDPYTLAKSAQIQLTVNTFWDVFLRQPAAFAAMVDAITS